MRKSFAYYAGNITLGCDPTPGSWDGEIFTSPDGSRWQSANDDDPSIDGSGVHYLIPA